MDVIIRQAIADDATDLAMLNRAVQDMHAGADATQFKAVCERDEVEVFFRNLTTRRDSFVLIAWANSSAAGYIWFGAQDRPQTPFTKARRRIYVHHVAVGEGFRRVGIGSALISAAEAEAATRGIGQVVLDTWTFNVEAQAFFQRLGFDPFNILMRKALPGST